MIKLHKRIGGLLARLLRGPARVVRRNLEICFPELDSESREDLARRHFESLGASIGELGSTWFGRHDRLQRLCRIEGLEHVQAALARGRGAILYSGHFTPLEICGPALKAALPRFAFMYSHRGNPLLDAMQLRGRARSAHESFDTDDVRALLRALRRNAAVWYAPDQAYAGRHSMLLPFFGEPAMTHTATSRIARMSGAAVVPLGYRRLPDDTGYVVELQPPLDDFPSEDIEADTRRLVALLEAMIRRAPEQYLWLHKKFRHRPAPLPDPYRRVAERA
jgi:KDO2-lipid IV(A) lauroyltransferase